MLNNQHKIKYSEALKTYDAKLKDTETYSYYVNVPTKQTRRFAGIKIKPKRGTTPELRYDGNKHGEALKSDADKVKQAASAYSKAISDDLSATEASCANLKKTTNKLANDIDSVRLQNNNLTKEITSLQALDKKITTELQTIKQEIKQGRPAYEEKVKTLEEQKLKSAATEFKTKFSYLPQSARTKYIIKLLSEDLSSIAELLEEAFEAGINLNILAEQSITSSHKPALDLAISKGFDITAKIKQLIDNENLAQIEKIASLGQEYISNCLIDNITPLQYALKNNKTETVKKILAANPACPQSENKNGENAIIYTIRHLENSELIKILINNTPTTTPTDIMKRLITEESEPIAFKFALLYPELINNALLANLISSGKFDLAQSILEQEEFEYLNNSENLTLLRAEFADHYSDINALECFLQYININEEEYSLHTEDIFATLAGKIIIDHH